MSERFVEQHAEGQTPAYSMTHEQLSRELSYRAALSIAARLGKSGVLSASELKHTEQLLRRKFSPPWGGLIR